MDVCQPSIYLILERELYNRVQKLFDWPLSIKKHVYGCTKNYVYSQSVCNILLCQHTSKSQQCSFPYSSYQNPRWNSALCFKNKGVVTTSPDLLVTTAYWQP